jgi:sodium pump decarboxylase gamma subunit
MWTEQTMSIPDVLIVCILGIVVVFLALIVLDLAIIITSKVIQSIEGRGKTAEEPKAAAAYNDEADKELLAVLSSVIAEDLDADPSEFRITSVNEIH